MHMSTEETGAGTGAEAAIRERIASYVEELTTGRDLEAAADYYTWDVRLIGPGMDLDRSAPTAPED